MISSTPIQQALFPKLRNRTVFSPKIRDLPYGCGRQAPEPAHATPVPQAIQQH
jgi:hypothetical protein